MTRLLLVAAALAAVLATAGVGAGAEWDVYQGAGTPIQDAIDGAGVGDTIYVHAGTYVENVDVWKRVTLIGDGADVVTVRAADAGDHVFEVTVDYVNISRFAVTGATHSGKAGIYLNGTDHCNISGTNASGNRYGIYLNFSSNNTLTDNNASLNRGEEGDDSGCGIYLHSSSYNALTNNTANLNSGYGGYRKRGNADDGYGYGIYLRSSSDNTLTNNTANSNIGSGGGIPDGGDTAIGGGGDGGDGDGYGIYLSSSCNNTLISNTANSNSGDGGRGGKGLCIDTDDGDPGGDYGYGIHLSSSSSDNTLYHNNLADNKRNDARDIGTNAWDSGTEGNYYSDYTGTDTNRDGIGDDPHPIPGGGGSVDRFPLMHPWTPPQNGDLNGDDQITPADAAIALAIAASGAHNDAADVSGDGSVTSLDALMILQAAVDSTTRKENRSAVIETSMGTMTAELYGQRAPNTTANFIELAESGFYDGLIFHRVIDNFVIQGGCPNGDGTGGSGKTIKLEIHPDLTHVDGAIAMARSQHPDSASSQFYICDGAQHFLDGQYAVFGKVIDGMGVVRAIAEVTTSSGDKPVEDVVISKISIIYRE